MPRGAEARAVRRGACGARVVELRAGTAAASALPQLPHGENVVVLGLCGALRRLRAGNVAVYERVAGEAGEVSLDAGLADVLAAALPDAAVVSACTVDRVVTTATGRAALARRFDADVVDMEGAPLAAALRARSLRFAMVRVVSDDASRDLPPLGDAFDAAGRLQPIRVALAFARAPRAAVAFVRDVRRALATLSAVAHAVDGIR